jgi:DNA-binding transcriptional ArsR family regulator
MNAQPCGQSGHNHAKSTMSHHFRVLILAGIVARRREGTTQFNRLRREEMGGRWPGLLDAVLTRDSIGT